MENRVSFGELDCKRNRVFYGDVTKGETLSQLVDLWRLRSHPAFSPRIALCLCAQPPSNKFASLYSLLDNTVPGNVVACRDGQDRIGQIGSPMTSLAASEV